MDDQDQMGEGPSTDPNTPKYLASSATNEQL